MATLPLLFYPDPRLRQQSAIIDVVDDSIRTLVDNLLETMYEVPGIGLAAPQVNVLKRLIVIDISEDKSAPLCLINPVIQEKNDIQTLEEGCLSVPGIYETIERANYITIQAVNRDGETIELEAEGLLSVCIQHEIDHLDGRLFVDYLSGLKQQRIRKKMIKLQRKA